MQESVILKSGIFSINISQAVVLAKESINSYIETNAGGRAGKHRAKKLKNFLESFPINNDYSFAILALFIALYGEPTMLPRLGRSSVLAGRIACSWIRGSYTLTVVPGHDNRIDTSLTSTVFLRETLEYLARKYDCQDSSVSQSMASYTFNHIKGIRVFCKLFIENLPRRDKALLNKFSKELERILNNGSEDLEIERFIVMSPEKTQKYAEAALKGAFETSKITSVSKLKDDPIYHIAGFLTYWDVIKTLRGVSRKANGYAQEALDKIITSVAPVTSAVPPVSTLAPLRDSKVSAAPAAYFKPADQKLSDVLPKDSLSSTSESTQNILLFLETHFGGEVVDETRVNESIIRASVVGLEKLAIKNQAADIELISQYKDTLERATDFLNDFLSFQEFPFKSSTIEPAKI